MIKNLKEYLLLMSLSLSALAMEQPAKKGFQYTITYTILNPKSDGWRLEGRNDNNQYMGCIEYERQRDAHWRITKFVVEPEFRKSGFGYGTSFLKKCFQEITKRSCSKITWLAQSTDMSLTQKELRTIYRKMIKKINSDVPGVLFCNDTIVGTRMTYLPSQS